MKEGQNKELLWILMLCIRYVLQAQPDVLSLAIKSIKLATTKIKILGHTHSTACCKWRKDKKSQRQLRVAYYRMSFHLSYTAPQPQSLTSGPFTPSR